MINETQFISITDTVIDKLEGGYYHPNMLQDGRVKDSRYGSSGETMLGIDRKNASSTSRNTPAWTSFWNIIDTSNAKNTWPWNYKGGDKYNALRTYAGQMMYPHYKYLHDKYLTPQAQAIVDADSRLTFNFAYAAWNGEGWFQKFAAKINDAVKNGTTDPNQLTQIAVMARTNSGNSLIAQTGYKIQSFIEYIPTFIGNLPQTIKDNKGKSLLIAGGLFIAAAATIYLKKKNG